MNDRERIRRWVDGELNAQEERALMADAERRVTLARAIDDARQVAAHLDAFDSVERATPPEDLVERSVRRAIRARDEHDARPARRWDWLWQPVTFRVRVASALMVTALVASAWLAAPRVLRHAAAPAEPQAQATAPRGVTPASAAEAPAPGVPVRFILPAQGAMRVSVAGDFNRWRGDDTPLQDDDGDGVFVGTLRIPPGTYAYMFVIDGERWVSDPYATNFREDDFGNQNAILRIN